MSVNHSDFKTFKEALSKAKDGILGTSKGDPKAQHYVGVSYLYGRDVQKNLPESAKWFEKSAKQGNADGQWMLGRAFCKGEGVKQDLKEGMEWYQKAAERGHHAACMDLSDAYKKGGVGIAKNPKEAFKWLLKASDAKHDDYYILAQIARAYYYGQDEYGVAQNSEKALEYYKKCKERATQKKRTEDKSWDSEIESLTEGLRQFSAKKKKANEGDKETQYEIGFMYYVKASQDLTNRDSYYQEALPLIQKSAEQGFAKAQLCLSAIYREGKGISKDEKLALEWCQKAAEQGDADAMNRLGYQYSVGDGVPSDKKKAFEWLLKAAQKDQGVKQQIESLSKDPNNKAQDIYQSVLNALPNANQNHIQGLIDKAKAGDREAQFKLAEEYNAGKAVPFDPKLASEWYTQAAQQGYLKAQLILAEMYLHGMGISKDLKAAIVWYQRAAEQGDAEAQFKLGLMYDKTNGIPRDPAQALVWYKKAAEKGHALARNHMGELYSGNDGIIPRDLVQAFGCFQEAAKKDCVNAIFNLGHAYFHGYGIAKDVQRGYELYQQAAFRGFADAQIRLGKICEHDRNFGIDIERNIHKAIEWYMKAAYQNNTEAQYILGELYIKGDKVTKDPKTALYRFGQAAAAGHIYAQYELAKMYEKGDGVQQDLKIASEWYQKSAEQGFTYAQCELGEKYFKGEGVARDLSKACVWFQKSIGLSQSKSRIEEMAAWGVKEAQDILANEQKKQNEILDQKQKAEKLQQTPIVQQVQIVVHQNKSLPPISPTETKVSKEEIQIKSSFKIDYNTLKFGKLLGEGGFGIVYQGTKGNEDVAIKQLKVASVSEDAREEFESEIQAMAKLRSKYIVQFYGYCLSPKYTIVMEFMPKGSLTRLLLSKEDLSWELRSRIMTDMACGLSVLHTENILHRDIKSLNVLLNEEGHAKISDFGLSTVKNEIRTSTKNVGGTIQWMAPELFSLRPKHTRKSDVYSLGMTFWEIAARQLPYSGAAEAVIKDAIKNGEREQIPDDCPKRFATLIQACWDGKMDNRPDSDTIVAYLKSGQDDFRTFLSSFMASRNVSHVPQSFVGNLNSVNNAGSDVANSTSLANSSFTQSLLGNLATGKP